MPLKKKIITKQKKKIKTTYDAAGCKSCVAVDVRSVDTSPFDLSTFSDSGVTSVDGFVSDKI